jgi:outer membrane protein OmpA-like peptidoglycan-associated protein
MIKRALIKRAFEMSSPVARLSTRILFIAVIGLSPLLAIISSAAATDERSDALSMRPRLVRAIPPQGAELRVDDFSPSRVLRSVHFDFARASIRPAEQTNLEANLEWLKANPTDAILIEGGADPRGTAQYNLRLGERRARAVRDYLVARGVSPERITLVTAGDVKPACRTADEACRSRDRRVDFLVKGPGQQAP